MQNLIEITGDDIAELGDADLRDLIGLLCESDYRLHGLSTKGITWGGNQDAPDGGVDVAVRGDQPPPKASFVPKAITIFQVKKPDMTAGEITKEMSPKGILRKSIRALIEQDGAYIIVCSSGSTADLALSRRVTAMRTAVSGEEKNSKLHLDFMDRGRIATWTRLHPSLVVWVRNKIGRHLKGWRSYENWANPSAGIDEGYLLDDQVRLHDGTSQAGNGSSILQGLSKLRSELSIPKKSVRLTGLSGVGKTRFVQALFDERVGEQPLNEGQVIYTDMSNAPSPAPVDFANQLVNERARCILIIDNCPPCLHHDLTQVVNHKNSAISLLTVEYDVRDDLPDETTVFRLEPASETLIEKLLDHRFKHISQVDMRTIATVSGGNARVAFALASTVKQGETLSGFRNDELFKRLFWQRHEESERLLISGQVCSLVYSFEGESINTEKSELEFLASLVGITEKDLYRDIAELKRRDLVQSRGIWRAVLPHAIANQLAKLALESIPRKVLLQRFSSSSDRLLKSFSRRLSYLHDNDNAIGIVNDLLDKDGLIGTSLYNLSDLDLNILKNIAPVSPERTLDAIERAANGVKGEEFTSRSWQGYNRFVQLLRHLAYSPELFSRSVKLLCIYALSEDVDESNNSIRNVLKSLFYIYLSGTHAPIEERIKIIDWLVNSNDKNRQKLGFFLLGALLEAWHFNAHHDFSFGARPRDFGYHPKTNKEVSHWFDIAISTCLRLALSEGEVSELARKVFANKLRGLWIKTGQFAQIERAVTKIQNQAAWNDGWIAVREIIRFDDGKFDEKLKERTIKLEALLRPNTLLEKVRTFALSNQHTIYSLEDDFDNVEKASVGYYRVKETAQGLGNQVAQDDEVFDILLPELVTTNNGNLYEFGKGLAEGSLNKEKTFNKIYNALAEIPPENRDINILQGFFSGSVQDDASWRDSKFDELIDDSVLGEWFPHFQINSTLDKSDVERLHRSLDVGRAQVWKYKCLAYGRAHELINDDELARLLNKISLIEGGVDVVIEILYMRFHKNEEPPIYSPKLMATAHKLLSTFTFENKYKGGDAADYRIASIVAGSLRGDKGISVARNMGLSLAKKMQDYTVSTYDWSETLKKFALVQPELFLDIFVEGVPVDDSRSRLLSSDGLDRRGNPLIDISDNTVLEWCKKGSTLRYLSIILSIEVFQKNKETEKLEWNPLIHSIIASAPEIEKILDSLAERFTPMSWSGSRAAILRQRASLLPDLFDHCNSQVVSWAKNTHSFLQEEIEREFERENGDEQRRNQSFE